MQATIGYTEGQWPEMGYAIDCGCYDVIGDEAVAALVLLNERVVNNSNRSFFK